MLSRREARSLVLGPGARGKRQAEREGRRLAARVRELHASGYSETTIMSVTRLPAALVREILAEGIEGALYRNPGEGGS